MYQGVFKKELARKAFTRKLEQLTQPCLHWQKKKVWECCGQKEYCFECTASQDVSQMMRKYQRKLRIFTLFLKLFSLFAFCSGRNGEIWYQVDTSADLPTPLDLQIYSTRWTWMSNGEDKTTKQRKIWSRYLCFLNNNSFPYHYEISIRLLTIKSPH